MCDLKTLEDNNKLLKNKKKSDLSRRAFNKLSAGAGLAMMLPPVANAQTVSESHIDVQTPDGVADCYFVHPSSGKHPAVIVWPDILGLRPVFEIMGKRLAESGYSVLVVNPFYRTRKAPVVGPGASFADEETRNTVFALAGTLNAETHFTDAKAFVSFLDQQDAVDTDRKMGTTGYCMGGSMVMRTVAAVPDRVGAGATFHGGGLATDAADSPHLLIPSMQTQMLHAIAENDDEGDPEAKVTLRAAYDAAGIPAEIEVYEGSLHGWCVLESAAYNETQAEKAWSRLLALFESALA